jgi:ATP-dependent exoDNAse (exonuclease V) beta subunit
MCRSTNGTTMQTELDREDTVSRERALDVCASFVVQAPAGSGKTGLLTQRLLALLASAAAPEEVLAITFTRKAAGEMRQRVIVALRAALAGQPPAEAYERVTFALAERALARSRELGWDLESHPSRLHILTIDALAQMLARSLPILSRAGAGLEVETDATALYDEASERLLAELEGGEGPERELAVLLEHFDNDYAKLRELLAAMLMRRDQWLAPILEAGDSTTWRAELERTLASVVAATLKQVQTLMPATLSNALWDSVIKAAGRIDGPDGQIVRLAQATAPVGAHVEHLALWQAAAGFLLTGDDKRGAEWRKPRGLNKTKGFPTNFPDDKRRHGEILTELGSIDGALDAWRRVAELAPPRYDEQQWRVLQALLVVLKRLAAHLRVIFTERGRVDYVEVAVAARDALGPPEDPTDLALRLDYRIRHLLVDEFQDTSRGQVELLRRLTAGWTGLDGRTLFCVGDPMQSIYRFRQADVALFLKVRHSGIGDLMPEALSLARNFRSQSGIVEWVNRAFSNALPTRDDLARGAVRYTPVQATRGQGIAPAVRVWPSIGLDVAAEGVRVVEIVRSTIARNPDASIAILARTRNHVRDIAAALRAAEFKFQAIELESLGERRAIRDLSALTRALCHRDDRIAWFALLRAPYCGLTLADLAHVGAQGRERTLWQLLTDDAVIRQLSQDGRARLERIRPIVAAALEAYGRRPLASIVEGTWLALGGPASVEDAADLDSARVFFQRLASLERAGDLEDPAALDEALADLYAAPDGAASDRLQIMTIHRAKGLEWDIVILPGLGRRPRNDEPRLLEVVEIESANDGSGLILAPARAAAEASEPLESFVRGLERERSQLESARLLYVAATRAREELHLLGHAEAVVDESGTTTVRPPARAALLGILWPVICEAFEAAALAPRAERAERARAGDYGSTLRRFVSGWSPEPVIERAIDARKEASDTDVELRPEFDWVTEVARLVGVVVHRDLERRVRARLAHGASPAVDHSLYSTELRELGVPDHRLPDAVARTAAAIEGILGDARGRWILAPHAEESSEWELTAAFEGKVRRLIIDRSFVDEEGTRWVIDYKTSPHTGGGIEEFLAREEERYAAQLGRYAAAVRRLGPQPVRAALYFPLLGAWRELSEVES